MRTKYFAISLATGAIGGGAMSAGVAEYVQRTEAHEVCTMLLDKSQQKQCSEQIPDYTDPYTLIAIGAVGISLMGMAISKDRQQSTKQQN
jgi:hypothetical protein